MLNARQIMTKRRIKQRRRQANLLVQINRIVQSGYKPSNITYIQGKQQPGLISR